MRLSWYDLFFVAALYVGVGCLFLEATGGWLYLPAIANFAILVVFALLGALTVATKAHNT